MPCEQKRTQNPKKIMFQKFLCLKTKENTAMSDEFNVVNTGIYNKPVLKTSFNKHGCN